MAVIYTLVDLGGFSYVWECSGCKSRRKATATLEAAKNCPSCKESIEQWIGDDDCDDADWIAEREG